MRFSRPLLALAALLGTLVFVPPAAAEFSSVFGGDLSCAAQTANADVRLCSGPTTTWDGQTKIDVNVILPPAPESGPDGPYPLIGDFHGWGGSKIGVNAQTQGWAENGYAVFSMSDRGWGNSCGSADPDKLPLSGKCTAGYNHLMDDRYEVRDAQYLISVLADEGVAQPQKVGATGVSYGGGISMALAALRDRTMLPDGTLTAWKSPAGTQMSLAAAVPQWPWSDLAYSLMPNGRTLDYVADAPYTGGLAGTAPIGVEKASYVSALYALGLALSNYAVPGADPGADLTPWYGLITAGEPYDTNPLAPPIIAEIMAHHSSYYVDHSQPPAPLLIQSGWNDDLFPADEALRFYNRTRTQFPGDPISLFFMDDGHARSQNKAADVAVFEARENAWFDHYLKGVGSAPSSSVETLTTTCGTPSEGPYTAATWKQIAPGEIRLDGASAQTISASGGNPVLGQKFDPFAGEGACASGPGADQAGVANYRLDPAPAGGFTLLGSPTIVADLDSPGGQSELAARLVDVAPGGTETLIARGLLRPGLGGERMVFQLHPQGFHFAAGDIAKLELLPSDAPYARPSNQQQAIEVSNLELRLPVLEQPGALEGLVQAPAPKVLPPGYQPAIDYAAPGETEAGGEEKAPGEGTPSGDGGGGTAEAKAGAKKMGTAGLARGRIAASAKFLRLRLQCAGEAACKGTLAVAAGRTLIATGAYSIAAGQSARRRLRLNSDGRAYVAAHRGARRGLHVHLAFEDAGRGPFSLTRPLHLPRG